MKVLFRGARVALLAPSGPIDQAKLQPTLLAIEALGLKPVVYPSACAKRGYLAGPDAQRAHDLQSAFLDPSIDGILCVRGGYGAARILPLLDWQAIYRNPKPIFGYSDITAIHVVLNNHGICSYHTPMPYEAWQNMEAYTKDYLLSALFGRINTLENPPGVPMQVLSFGAAEGPLCGGNLSLVTSSLGTPYEIDTLGKVLFLEDVGEPVYKIDQMLTQLRNAGKLEACAGILLGSFTGIDDDPSPGSIGLFDVFDDLLLPCKKPIIANLCCGHQSTTMSLPLGATIQMDAAACKVSVSF